jgi:hypothetical protein
MVVIDICWIFGFLSAKCLTTVRRRRGHTRRASQTDHFLHTFLWGGEENDAFWISRATRALSAIEAKVYRVGAAPSTPIYSNTTLAERTAVGEIYRLNLDSLRKEYDPDNVLGQAGGFSITFPAQGERALPPYGYKFMSCVSSVI